MGIKNITIIGAGLIGSSWATLFARFGYETIIYDLNDDLLKQAETLITNNYNVFLEADVMDEKDVKNALKKIHFTSSISDAMIGADYIQECVPEKLEIKKDILSLADKYNPTAIFASSSSALKTTDIQKGSQYPKRVIGAHPFNPPHLMPLVELIVGEETERKNIEIAKKLYISCKKEPIVLNKEIAGFVGNRLQAAYTREIVDIVMNGVCSVEDADKASLYGLGLRYAIIGPALNGELNGGDNGLQGYYEKYGESVFETCLRDNMAEWKEFPKEYTQKIGPEGVKSEKNNRPAKIGRTREEITKFRDELLVEILKLHDKI